MAEATLVRDPDTAETEPAAEATTEVVTTEDRGAEGTTTETETGAKTEPETNPETAALEANLRAQWEQEQRDRDEAAETERKRTERVNKMRDDFRELHANAKTELREKFGTITVQGNDGETFPVALGEPTLKMIDSAIDKAALKAGVSVELKVRAEIIDAVTAGLPAGERETTAKALASVLDLDDKGQLTTTLPEVVKAVRAVLVPDPKKMTVDDLPPHIKTEISKLKKELWDAQHPKPAGESAGSGGASAASQVFRDMDEARAAHTAGRIDNNELRRQKELFGVA